MRPCRLCRDRESTYGGVVCQPCQDVIGDAAYNELVEVEMSIRSGLFPPGEQDRYASLWREARAKVSA